MFSNFIYWKLRFLQLTDIVNIVNAGREFSGKSLSQLSTCHKDLRLIAKVALQLSPVDFGVSEGNRSFELQLKYFKENKSKLDPRVPEMYAKAMHLKIPSMAFDFFACVPGKRNLNYDNEHLTAIGTTLLIVGKILYSKGFVKHEVRWGGNWDRDSEIITDQIFDDRPHIELIPVL